MKTYKLNKAILSVRNNAAEFLNGLTANSLDTPHNAFLDIHGKIIATFDQVKVGDDQYFLLIEASFVESVLRHLRKYALLSHTEIKIEEHRDVFFDLDDTYVIDRDECHIPQKKGKIIITRPEKGASSISAEEFTLFRLKHHIPWHGIDYRD